MARTYEAASSGRGRSRRSLRGCALDPHRPSRHLPRPVLNRPKLRALVTIEYPEFKPDRYSDHGGDPGPSYVRLEITNVGRRPITLRSAGLSIRFAEVGPSVLWVLRVKLARHGGPIRGVPREEQEWDPSLWWAVRGRLDDIRRHVLRRPDLSLPFTPMGSHENRRLDEGESWALRRKEEDVAWDVAGQTRGQYVLHGVYAQSSTGKLYRWGPKALAQRPRLDIEPPEVEVPPDGGEPS